MHFAIQRLATMFRHKSSCSVGASMRVVDHHHNFFPSPFDYKASEARKEIILTTRPDM